MGLLGLARFLLVESPLLVEPVAKAIAADVPDFLQRHVEPEAVERFPLLAAFTLSSFVCHRFSGQS